LEETLMMRVAKLLLFLPSLTVMGREEAMTGPGRNLRDL